ncbi:MAG TPA: response regulator [Tahibacter sp.]|nr:response regulator [Tahibacter sp.]
MFHVLLVDDEPNVISALKRSLARIPVEDLDGEPLDITGFTSPLDALDQAGARRYDLVICDYRMPHLTGTEFLARFIEKQPSVARMILSGCADRDIVVEALNTTQISRFIDKPWGEHTLRQTVVALLHQHARTVAVSHLAHDEDADTDLVLELEALEEECPGITYVDRDDDGYIVLPLDED